MTKNQVEKFLNELTELSRKHCIKIHDVGLAGQSTLSEFEPGDMDNQYTYYFSGDYAKCDDSKEWYDFNGFEKRR